MWVGSAQVRHHFGIPLAAEDRTANDGQAIEAGRGDLQLHIFDDCVQPLGRKHAALQQPGICFIVRLNQRYDAANRFQHPRGGGENLALFRPSNVNDNQINKLRKLHMHRVGSLHRDHTWVSSQFPFQGAVAGVDGVHFRGSPLQKAVGKPAGVAAEVGADEFRDVDCESAQPMIEFEAGS